MSSPVGQISDDETRAALIRALEVERMRRRKEKLREKNKRNWAKYGPAERARRKAARDTKRGGPRVFLTEEERKYRARDYAHKKAYGITLAEKERLLAKQANACAICKRTEFGKRRPHTDHCHETGRVRGVLCANCNKVLGLFKDNPETFRTAAAYLEADS